MSEEQKPITQQQIQAKGKDPLQNQQPQDKFVYEQPSSQPYQYRIFINDCNGYVGSQLVETFRNDHIIQTNPNIIYGVNSPKSCSQASFESCVNIIDSNNKTLYHSILWNCDIIIFVLNSQNGQQFEYLVKVVKEMSLQKPKKVICISSLLSWGGRRTNNFNNKILDIKNLHARQPIDSYQFYLENLCLGIKNHNSYLHGSVIGAGIIYGYGQNELFYYFKQALQQTEDLQIYGTGSNKIPMIHLEDLCSIIHEVAMNEKYKNEQSYYLAADHSSITQKNLIEGISNNIGNGKVKELKIQQCFLKDNFDTLTFDATVCQHPNIKSWHCRNGILENIAMVVSQFNIFRGLKPNKIIVIGPPAAGKSKISTILNKIYGLPILTVKDVVDKVKSQQGQFADRIRQKLEELKAIKVQQEKKLFQDAKKKKKGKGPVEQFDPDKVVPRLPDEDLASIYQRRLRCSDCMNKGYILDGWPKSYSQAKLLFMGEENKAKQDILPNSVFYLVAAQEQVKERIKKLPQQQTTGTHWNEQHTVRRFQQFNKQNQEKKITQFFNGLVDVKNVQFNYQGSEHFSQFVERNGPLGFKKKQQPKLLQKEEQRQKQQQNKLEQDENVAEEKSNEQQQQFDIEKLKENQRKILNQKSRPIRQYLIDNVIPQITEGLLQICKNNVDDPILFLIKFLEHRQQKKKKITN